jgi:hypothetical protein
MSRLIAVDVSLREAGELDKEATPPCDVKEAREICDICTLRSVSAMVVDVRVYRRSNQ